MRPLRAPAAPLVALALVAAGCGGGGGGGDDSGPQPSAGTTGDVPAAMTTAPAAAPAPAVTKNTSRVGGADPTADAAAVARAVFPGGEQGRPGAVVLAPAEDWRAGVAAAVLMAPPLRAPLLLSDPGALPAASADALAALDPKGAQAAGGAQVIRVGEVADAPGRAATDLRGQDAFALARAVDAFRAAAAGEASERVLVVGADAPAFAMPAAAWAAKSGDPVLFTAPDALPPDTRAAIRAHGKPDIYILGPESTVSAKVERQLARLGSVKRISGDDPVTNAIAFARYANGDFGWGITDPGHGLVFASAGRPADAGAAAPLSASGTYGPLLLLEDAGVLPGPLESYLLDIQPGFQSDPVRGVYNHGWIVGDQGAISAPVQSQIDGLLEIAPVTTTDAP